MSMGIYIPNMEIPKGIETLVVFSNGTVHKCLPGMREYVEKGTTVPVQAHGRLGDLDALTKEVNRFCDQYDAGIISTSTWANGILYALFNAPTIIEAEEG